MKFNFLCLLISFLLFSTNVFSQSLGNDQQSDDAVANGVGQEAEAGTSFRIVPHQWVDLTDPTKEAAAFEATVGTIFAALSTDEAAEFVNMDMEFTFFGEKYRQTYVVLNGFLAFGNQVVNNLVGPNSWSPGAIPSPRVPNNIVAPFWADLDFSESTGFVYHRTFKPGDSVDDHFICQWEKASFFRDSEADATFQVILFTEGGIMFQYRSFSPSPRMRADIKFWQEIGVVFFDEEGNEIKPADMTEFEIIKELISLSIGIEDEAGFKGASWNLPIASGMSIGNELIPDWATGGSSDNFFNFEDGRDRKNQAVTGDSGGGCFISAKSESIDR